MLPVGPPALVEVLCVCSSVEGTGVGTHSELNPRTIETYKRLKTTRSVGIGVASDGRRRVVAFKPVA